VGHLSAAVDQHPHLSAGLVAEPREESGEVLGHQALRREPPSREALELADLAGLQALRVAEDVDDATSSYGAVAAI
jgi:hypothetical protein